MKVLTIKSLLLGLIIFSSMGCSVDDNPKGELDTRLFLKKMAGSIWTNQPDGDIFGDNFTSSMIIFRFNNDINHPWDKWQSSNLYGCWKREFSRNEGYDFEVLEHSDLEFKVLWSCPNQWDYINEGSEDDYQMKWEFIDDQLFLNGSQIYKYNGSDLSDLNQCTNYNDLSSEEYGIIEAKANNLYLLEDETTISFQPYPIVEFGGDFFIGGKSKIGESHFGLSVILLGEFGDINSVGTYSGINVTLIEGPNPVCQAQYEHGSNLNFITITEVTDGWISGTFDFELIRYWYPQYSSLYEGYFHIKKKSATQN